MSSQEIIEASPLMVNDEKQLRLALNAEVFEKYRSVQAGTVITAFYLVSLCVLFLAFGAYTVIYDPSLRSRGIMFVLMSLWLACMVCLATWPAMLMAKDLTRTLKENLPALVMNQDGITDNSSNYVFGFIPWNEIEAVRAASRSARPLNKDFVGIAIVVKDKKVLIERKPKMTAVWLNMEAEIAERRQVFVPQGRIVVPVEDVVEQINAFRAKLKI